MRTGWGDAALEVSRRPEAANYATRRAALVAAFPGETLVIPTGREKVRANDTALPVPARQRLRLADRRARPRLGADHPARRRGDAVHPPPLAPRHRRVLPQRDVRRAVDRPPAHARGEVDRARRRHGQPGRPGRRARRARPGPHPGAARLRPGGRRGRPAPTTARRARPAGATASWPRRSPSCGWSRTSGRSPSCRTPSTPPCAASRTSPGSSRPTGRCSERLIEGIFGLRARHDGNDLGYCSIVGAGAHATILHWIRNTGATAPGELLLMDMGVENRNLYTADVTRTIPVNGRFTPAQREVYDIVYASQQAGIDAVSPGREVRGRAPGLHAGARRGPGRPELLPVHAGRGAGQGATWSTAGGRCTASATCSASTCTTARTPARRSYRDGELGEGYVLTVEPGLYFQPEDELVPEELRGVGIRIEDDVLVTADGAPQPVGRAAPHAPRTWRPGSPPSARPAPACPAA